MRTAITVAAAVSSILQFFQKGGAEGGARRTEQIILEKNGRSAISSSVNWKCDAERWPIRDCQQVAKIK